jgi:hypothetical protein
MRLARLAGLIHVPQRLPQGRSHERQASRIFHSLYTIEDVILGDGILDQIGQPLDVQLFHDVMTMPPHREDADVERVGNLVGIFALRQKL